MLGAFEQISSCLWAESLLESREFGPVSLSWMIKLSREVQVGNRRVMQRISYGLLITEESCASATGRLVVTTLSKQYHS